MQHKTPTLAARRASRLSRHAVLAVVLAIGSVSAWAADTASGSAAAPKPLPIAVVDTLNQLAGGVHPGYRANHAKGVLVTGTFTPASGAAAYSMAPHFAAKVPVLVRFSNATGVPTMPDASPNGSPHGIAIRFQLPGGENTDIVSISANGFPVATPEEFLSLLQAVAASGDSAVKPSPIEQFLGSHPVALKFVTTPRPAPVSFGTLAFYGVNAFKFTNAKGVSRFVRYQILPVAGEQALDAALVAKAAPDYLMDELPQRIAKSAVQYRLLAQVASDTDQTIDGSQVWPAERSVVELGTLSLTGTPVEQVLAQKALLFNPLLLPAGIEASADPVLLARPGAYAVSYGQRAR